MTCHLFTYGSLMFTEVWERVAQGRYRSAPAELAGHARYAIKGETYPGVIEQPGGIVRGVLYFDIAPKDLATLDAFEGDDYRRVTVTVDAGAATVAAATYLYLPAHKLATAAWEPDAFQLRRFLATYCRAQPD